ncbi:MAG TPA: penicillin-binding transpeptidase domain-containing protein [Patescibacteria group bacterium]|nr:penicillin-binding transpeptidase domain-containing protein [Patescibacteria group bacterium]
MPKIKVGPAFFDSVKGERISRSRSRSNLISDEVLVLAPLFFLFLFFGIILARLFYLQILRGDYYKTLSDQNRTRTLSISAPRGIIFDRNGKPLVSNSPSFKIIENGKVRLLSKDEALRMISDGKPVQNDVLRDYREAGAFAHVVGYIGQISPDEINLPEFDDYSSYDFVGKSGLEKEYEKYLHGVDGKFLYEVDSRGVLVRQLGEDPPTPGYNLNTTLDGDIGLSVESAMKGVEHGAVVVSDPRNGGILALFSAPSFDPNLFTHPASYKPEGQYKDVQSVLSDSQGLPLLDRATGGAYPPGSTFKLVAATAALEKGSIDENTEIEDTGILKVGTFSFGNWYYLQYGRTEGNLNIVGAIKRSNDIFFYKTAEKTGVDYISSWARTFGMGSKLNIDLPSEAEGTIPTIEWKEKNIGEQWYLGDTYNYGIGQGYILATPLQVNSFTEVFANGGTLWQPHLLADQTKAIKTGFIKPGNINLVRQGMLEACDTGGVAWPLFDFKVKNPKLKIDNIDYTQDASAGANMVHVKVACKTGTAETSPDKAPDAWITVFAPFNHPEIAVTVLVENGGEGSSIAGPIAKQILTDYFTKKNN